MHEKIRFKNFYDCMTSCFLIPLFFFGGATLFGQKLQVSAASGTKGETIVVDVSLNLPRGQFPAALKWETVFPAQLLQVEGDPEIGKAGREFDKSLACHQHAAYSYICIVAGGQKPIANGAIAEFRFKIRTDAKSGNFAIRTDRIEAVTRDLKIIQLSGSEGRIEIQ